MNVDPPSSERIHRIFFGCGELLLWPGRRCTWPSPLATAAIKADRFLFAAKGVDDFAIEVHRATLGGFAIDYGVPLRFGPSTKAQNFDPLYGRGIFVPWGQRIEIELTNVGARPFTATLGVLGYSSGKVAVGSPAPPRSNT